MRSLKNVGGGRLRLLGLVVLILATLSVSATAAPLNKPTARDRQVAIVVKILLKRKHLTKHPLDDEISQRALKTFLKSLDPMKVYFYQADVDAFKLKENQIDDMLKRGDISFAYDIFKVFLQRVDERVATVNVLLKRKFDFNLDEEIVTDPDLLQYPKTPQEAEERWRKRIKYDLLGRKADDEDDAESRDRLRRRYHSFASRMHQVDSDDLLQMFLTAVTTSYDPHTTYMSPNTLENFRIMMRLNLEGIGAQLKMEDGYTIATKIIPGGAADKAGQLKAADRIVSVGQGEDGEMIETADMRLDDVVGMIRGSAGTVVRLGVLPGGAGEKKIYKITRAKIELKDSEARSVIFEQGQKPDGQSYRIGVIDLPSFYMDMEAAQKGGDNFKSTTRDVRRILEKFNTENIDAVVLDLRRNGGGSLTESINLTGLFIDQGPVVQVKDADSPAQHYDDLDSGMVWKWPLVVLTSKFSASASEILAGALQDYHRAIIVGDKATHGKGTVQSLLELGPQLFRAPNPPNLGALKITMQQFYRPNGESTQKRGVLADVVLPSLTDQMDVGESDLDYAVPFDRVAAAKFSKYNMTPPDVLSRLKAKSLARVNASEDFQKLAKNIEQYR